AKDGRVLGALEWLGDEHIQRDYQLLEQELQGNNPDLAARTRFVDPLVANYHLRLGSESVMLSAFQRIVHQNGNDTADFLFVPVSDGGKTLAERGTHWSLLFVDRSDRERPVAYHYDSYNGCNDTLAKELAENLGASLETRVGVSRIAQQSNVVDCGVYVVDGTRALVGRLQSQPDNLNLNNLVVNRQALQTRLRGDNTFGTANNLTNFELMDRQARDAVKESPVGTFHQQIKRLGQSAPDVAPGDPFKFQSLESKGDAAAQRSGPQEEYSWPEYLPPGKANEDDAVLASSFVPTGPHHQASDPAGSFRPLSWRDGDQRAPDERIAAQDRSNLLPSEEVPLRPPEFAPPSLRAGNSASPELFPEGMSPAVEGFFGVFGDPSGRVLGALQLLGDEHIHRDYQLLEQELQGNNPELAARTRFVDPLVANYHLRLGSESDKLSAFQRIVHNQNGNDTADFLFVPVSDGGKTLAERGKHWSLLFVDRSDRERPVAYHYDSVSGWHDKLAKHLAERLGASLETRVDLPRIAQQSNEWDCGVYVVDGTRALVGRLQRWQPDLPDLNLNNLVVNRQALQTRLMGDDTSGTANYLTNFELMDRQARDAVKESPVGTFHQRIKRLGQSARALHDRALAPVAPDQGNPDSVFVRDVVPGETRHHHAPDSSVVDLNPPAPFELRDHARSMPAAVQPDPPVVVSGRDKRPLYSNDATVVEGLRSALYAGKVGERTVTDHVNSLLGFGRWLFDNNKPGFATRLDDPLLDQDLKEYQRESGSSNVARALGRLKESAGGAPMVGRAALNPDPADAVLIKEYKAALIKEYKGAPATGPNRQTIHDYGATLRRFSEYLVENNKPGIAARLHEESLDEDAKRYKASSGDRRIIALAQLRKFLPSAALGREIALAARPEDALGMEARAIGDAAAQHSGPQKALGRPEKPPGKAKQLSEIGNSGARVLMQAPTHQVGALPWEAQPMMQGSGQEHAAAPYAGGSGSMLGASVLQPGHSTARHHHAPDSSVVDLNPPAPSELRDHARSVPAAVQPDRPKVVSGRDKGPLYSNDATVVEGLRSAYAGKVKESTVKRHVNSLLGFGRWLFDNNRPGFAARLDESSLDQDRKEYESRGGPSEYESRGGPSIVARALGRLKTLAGGAPVVDRPVRNPYPADAALIRDYTAALIKEYKEAPATGPNRGTIQVYGSTLIRFSEYLHENKKPGIADRLHEGSLDEDAKRYVNSGGNRRISALAHLRKFAPGREIALAARPEDAVGMEARAIGDAAAQTAAQAHGHAGEQGPISRAQQVAPAPFERHLGKKREAQDGLTSTLDRSNLVNSGGVIINNEHYTALLRPAKRQRTDNPQSRAMGRQLSEATTTSISQASDQARADLMASFRSRERSDAGR
ncbi:Ulp1 family isopeptidase, partial [Mesorhizobium sp. M1143]|uniref:Ulp1 family isopeptidase n=1 Tax=Mesorhizobium sp. M1143 TaxID=2957061 RepID=UPI00333A7BD5